MFNVVRVDSVPLTEDDFSGAFKRWLSALVDALNEEFQQLENEIALANEAIAALQEQADTTLVAPSYTTAEIAVLTLTAPDGSFWYDTDTTQLLFRQNGAVIIIA